MQVLFFYLSMQVVFWVLLYGHVRVWRVQALVTRFFSRIGFGFRACVGFGASISGARSV